MSLFKFNKNTNIENLRINLKMNEYQIRRKKRKKKKT